MKDLKHLIYFEHLLDEAANELVMQAVSEGKHAVGYTCYHMPEVLLNLDNCFSVRMRAPRTGSLEISTYYMTNYLCGYAKALVERGIEGGYNFLSALAGGETCTEMNRTLEHFEVLQLVKNEKFSFPSSTCRSRSRPTDSSITKTRSPKKSLSRCTRDTARTFPMLPYARPLPSTMRSAAS